MANRKILLAEDHSILREGLRALLANTPNLEIVGEAADGQEAIQQARLLEPHLILMDLSMPHINGTEAIRAIKRRNPDIKIIALTVHKSEEYVRATLDAGADGYVLKDDTRHDLLTAIESVQKGKIYLSPGICNQVVTGFLGGSSSTPSSASWDMLTDRERAVLKLIAEGQKNREIADYLSVSLKTVEKHRSNLMKKLDLHNAAALTAYAIENGLVHR
jgi:DNA-binding NarL/FixJ family response regulator